MISYAKINAFLDIVNKRKDGFHNIKTVFIEIEVNDKLSFSLTNNQEIKILANVESLQNKENLIYKVAAFLQKEFDVKFGVEITLEKNIPIAAGLGGGSSNAASTIIGLSELWDLKLSKNSMNLIAEKFGSDINFFLEGGIAVGSGRGEIINQINNISNIENIFLVNPGFAVSSKEAYNNIAKKQETHSLMKFLENFDFKFSYNALQNGICKIYPQINSIINEIKKNGAMNSILSGSGPTIIGFCPNREIAESLQKKYSTLGFWTAITKAKKRKREKYNVF